MSEHSPIAKRPKLDDKSISDEIHALRSEIAMYNLFLRVKRLSEFATIPVRASTRAAGYDLFAAYECTIPANGKALVKTDLSLAIPMGHYGRIAPRSSLALKNHIDIGAGVIDEDYRGPLGIVMFNFGEEDFLVKRGDRVAQLIIERISNPEIIEVDDLDETDRGEGGFGSTGTASISKFTEVAIDKVENPKENV